ncbi:MAG: Spy/CpxP family protein refolding chaperone [Nitrospiraceae bacterium]
MKKASFTPLTLSVVALFLSALFLQPAWANPPAGEGPGKGSDKESYGKEGGHGMGRGMGMMHGGTGHFIRHLLKHEKEIGLKEDQVAKLKELQTNLDKTRTKAEEDIMAAQREIKTMVDDEKTDLAAIEAKLKQSEDQEVALRMSAIKTRREALALLTPEQREKEKAEHQKMMQQHKEKGKGHGDPRKGEMKKDEGKKE